MIWFILIPIITVVAGLLQAKSTYYYKMSAWGTAGWAFGISLAIAVVLNAGLGYTGPSDTYKTYLVALQDNSGVHGSFFLGSGTIDSKFEYAYYWMDTNGGARLATKDADDAEVFQDTVDNPYLSWKVHRPNKWLSLFDDGSAKVVQSKNGHDFQFHVPPNSIMSNYTLDAK